MAKIRSERKSGVTWKESEVSKTLKGDLALVVYSTLAVLACAQRVSAV